MKSKEHQSILLALHRIEKKVDQIGLKSTLDKEYLSTREACTFLACSRSMIWKLVKEGKLNRFKMENGRTYYLTTELKKVIAGPETPSAA